MRDLLQIIVTGTAVGSVLALIALGFNLVFATTRIVNFAQGSMLVVAGFVTYVLTADLSDQRVSRIPWTWAALGLPLPIALLISAVIATGVGALVQVLAIKPLGRFDPKTNIGWILTTFGIGLALTNVITVGIGSESRPLPPLVGSLFGWTGGLYGGVFIGPNDVMLVVISLSLVAGIETIQRRTMLGRAFRAVSQDRQAASLMGIDPEKMVLLTFAMAGFLAAIAVVLVVPRQNGSVSFTLQLLGLQAFVAAVLGGLGSMRGAVLGGFATAFVSAAVTTLSSATYEPLVVFAAFLAILVFRPNGILGEPVIEKV